MELLEIKGIGPKKKEYLNSMGIYNKEDLIKYKPFRYEDRSKKTNFNEALNDVNQYFQVHIVKKHKTFYKGKLSISKVSVTDGSQLASIIWFNNPYITKSLRINEKYKVFGRFDKEKKELINPVIKDNKSNEIGGIYPIYSLKKGITNRDIIEFKNQIFSQGKESIFLEDYIHDEILNKYNIKSDFEIYYKLNNPKNYKDLYEANNSLVIKDLIIKKLSIDRISNKKSKKNPYIIPDLSIIYDKTPYKLTSDQNKALKEIVNDLSSDKLMNRLLLGDVGSGKTIVAIISAIISIMNGKQVAFMAPTEILARQHYKNYKDFLMNFNISSDILTSSSKNREETLRKLKENKVDLIFGTHALFQKDVIYRDLGLIILDEQQRFGVYQRKTLYSKGKEVNVLSLSATPIPRTLRLTLYGEMDISTIETLPSNRKDISTYYVGKNYESRFIKFIRNQIESQRQVYIVASRVYEDEEKDLESVESLYRKYKKYFNTISKDVKVDYLHGQMTSEEKEIKQSKFYEGKIDILISTTIIEVGIDVKNASLIVIYDANNFGLSQLHQLRGRVGRGPYKSHCILVDSSPKNKSEKLKFLEKSNDGFEISEKDLELRGGGDIYGIEQSGFIDSRIIDYYYNEKNINLANKIVEFINSNKEKYYTKKLLKKIDKYDRIILN